MAIPTRIVPQPERPSRLAQLGLDGEDQLRDAMYAADAAASRVTANHPRGWANLERYGFGIAELRAITLASGWSVYREDGLEGVLRPDGRVLILISSGCDRTGREDDPVQPETKNVKGPKVGAKVEANAQTTIFEELTGGARVSVETDGIETWILLHHKDARSGELRLELSCPREIVNGRPSDWRERIPLTPFPGNDPVDDSASQPDWPDTDSSDDIDLDWRDDAAGA